MSELNFDKFATLESARAEITRLEQQLENGDGKAGFTLHCLCGEGCVVMPEEIKAEIGLTDADAIEYLTRSFPLLRAAADAGDGESMNLIAIYYQTGFPPVALDHDLFEAWVIRAEVAGYPVLENLIAIYGNPKSKFYDREKARKLWRSFVEG